ncbi:MAG: tetratricopeptide repeat protein [Pseudomonadota bacterium]
MNPLVQRLENMLEAGSDNLLLRFGLGKAYAEIQQYDQAIAHLERAVAFDPMHSSSWFWLGRAQYEHGRFDDAKRNLDKAVQVASERKDSQTVKMAQVFLRRIEKLDLPGQAKRS